MPMQLLRILFFLKVPFYQTECESGTSQAISKCNYSHQFIFTFECWIFYKYFDRGEM